MVKVVGIQKARLFPINSRSVYSFKNGNPTINFQISPDPTRLVDVNSLRLNYVLNVLDDVTTRNNQTPCRVNNQNQAGGGARACLLDDRVGVNSIVDVLRLSNFKNEVIEEIRNYSRLLASSMPALTSFAAYKNWNSVKNLAFARSDTEGLAGNGPLACSVALRAGILNAGAPISTNDLDGLKISLQLAPDNFVLYGGNATDCHYEISKVCLTYNWIVLDSPDPVSSETLQYPSYSSFINIVQSSDDQQSLMMNLTSVRAAFTNFIKTSHLNNFTHNSLETNRLRNAANDDKDIKTYTHMRNNVKFPKKYDVRETIPVTNGVYEAHLGREYLDCFRPFRQLTSTLQSPETQGFKTTDTINEPDVKYVGGLGNNYDMLQVGMGANFKDNMYALRLQSELDDSTSNTAFTYSLSNQGLAVRKQNVQPVM
jgi:hypothetical protein